MKLDVVSLITPSASFLASSYLTGSTPNITWLGPKDANGVFDLVYMKGLTGEPWDWMVVKEDAIYQLLTENVWSDPSSGKIYLRDGAPRFPRYIDYSPNQPAGSWVLPDISGVKTTYYILGPGGTPTGMGNNGIVRCTFSGPFPTTYVGNLPAGNDWLLSYERGGKIVNGAVQFAAKEILYHREGYGRYGWEQYTGVNGVYQTLPSAFSRTTTIVPLPSGGVIPKQLIF